MLKRLSTKKKKSRQEDTAAGAAVPYRDPDAAPLPSNSSELSSLRGNPFEHVVQSPKKRISVETPVPDPKLSKQLVEAIRYGNFDDVKRVVKQDGVDINARDEKGQTPLHLAAGTGKSRIVRYLLIHGADIESKNSNGHNCLYSAVDEGHAGTVGVLLDYMQSVDNRTREPFVLIRALKPKGSHLVHEVRKISEMKSFKRRGIDSMQLFIAHGQKADDLGSYLGSTLDDHIQHSFFINTHGDFSAKNFQRFQNTAKSQSVTILNTFFKTLEPVNFNHMKNLVLVSCDLSRLSLSGLPNLELLDLRYNKLHALPETIKECVALKTIKCSHNQLRRLPTELAFLARTLMAIDCSFNQLRRLSSHIIKCTELRYLQCDHNSLTELPIDIGMLILLEDLLINNNKICQLPISVATLNNLQRIAFHSNPLQNIPVDFPEGAEEVRKYLTSLQDDPIANTTVKLVLVGQEGVGKSTLLKALKRSFWLVPRTPTTPKTDGIDVKEIKLDNLTLRCFDCGGDVDFNESHNFFITQGALYLVCFNLSEYCLSTVEKSSFLLGRLQLWLQYIFSRVPSAQVIIVGTHADHDSLTKTKFEQIWDLLRTLLVTAREHHRNFFRGSDRLADCLLCQSDSKCLRRTTDTGNTGYVNLGYEDNSSVGDHSSISDVNNNIVSFPHIVGYYEVSSTKSVGNENILQLNQNLSIQHLKDAIYDISKRLIQQNPEIPRRWSSVKQSLQNHIELDPFNSVCSIEEVCSMAKAQGLSSRPELLNMLHFFKAQGHVLFFPQLEQLEELVILDPEWLAKIFASVVSYKDTGISNEGFMDREVLKATWTEIDRDMRDNILKLLRHFGLCLPVSDTNLELFPTKLPFGEPDDVEWPRSPAKGDRQVTYSVTFASIIPPPFFGSLMVAIFRHRAASSSRYGAPSYFANTFMEFMQVEKMGCWQCQQRPESAKNAVDQLVTHKALFELIPHKRSIQITVRGPMPCCLVRKIGRILNRVLKNFEGLGSIEMDTIVCPGCWLQKLPAPHKFSIKYLVTEHKKGEKIYCGNAHILPDPKSLLCGIINDTCMPNATMKPKNFKVSQDFSGCPHLFIVLPVNKDGLSFDHSHRLFVSSLMYDGYAGHLLCEFPDGYHLTRAPGYRLKSPKDFMSSFGSHVIHILRLLQCMAGSTVSSGHSTHTTAVIGTIEDILKDYNTRFSFKSLKEASQKISPEELLKSISAQKQKVKRDDLRKAFHVVDKPDTFGPLKRLRYGDSFLWLCSDHYRQLKVLTIGSNGVQATVESRA